MPTAERLYHLDSGLFDFRARVTDIREYARKDGVQVWQMALDRTAFYPTSGGQPHDLGTLTATARSGAQLSVQIEDVVEDEAGEIWHTTTKPLLTGTPVEGSVDADRRMDHMQQHSGQHLLSAVLAAEFSLRTTSFHLGTSDTTIDLIGGTPEAEEAIMSRWDQVEQRVNQLVATNLPLQVRVVTNAEAQALLANGALRKLPKRDGDIRLVEIPGVDLNACGGTHVHALGSVGGVLLREVERVKKTMRLHFVCGLRATRSARADWLQVSAAAGALSVARDGVADAVERAQAEVRVLTKERQRLREDVAMRHAVQLAVEEQIEGGLRLVYRRFADRDAEYIRLLASRLLMAVPHTAAILVSMTQEPATLVLASNLVVEGNPAQSCAHLLRSVLALFKLRGGGTAELAQAQIPAELLDPVTQELLNRLSVPQDV